MAISVEREIYITRRIEQVTELLDGLYRQRLEAAGAGGVKSYTIGSRTVTRYDLGDGADITEEIKSLEKELRYLQAELEGRKRRRSVRALIRDV